MNIDELSRIHWACRRGMLELDKLFEGYFLEQYPTASKQEQQYFIDLLACADQDLFNWLLGDSEPNNENFKTLCQKIRKTYIRD
jgi:antitoxin CptB